MPNSPDSSRGIGTPSVEESAGAQFSVLIRSQIDEEAAFRATVEQRATNVVTSSGTLVSLLFAFAAFAKGSEKLILPNISKVTLIAALVCFVAAVATALAYMLVNTPYLSLSVHGLRQVVTPEAWNSPEVLESSRYVAQSQVQLLESRRKANAARAQFVSVAVGMEVLAVIFLGVSIVGILVTY